MLADVCKVAKDNWNEFSNKDLEILFKVSVESAKSAAEIARNMGHLDVANEIMEKALNP